MKKYGTISEALDESYDFVLLGGLKHLNDACIEIQSNYSQYSVKESGSKV